VKEIPGSEKNQGNRGVTSVKRFSLMYYIHIFLYDPLVTLFLPAAPVPLISPSFSQSPRGLQEAQNILPTSSISCFCLSPLAFSTGEGELQHPPLLSFGSSPLVMLAIVRLISACVYPEKTILVWCACHIWHVPSPLISPLWTSSTWSRLESPLSCSPGDWFLSTHTNICFSLHLFHS